MAQNGTGIDSGKSEHVLQWGISRATTLSADFMVLGQRCGQQVSRQKVYHVKRPYPVHSREQ
jgi:protein-tyrosine phosphatase